MAPPFAEKVRHAADENVRGFFLLRWHRQAVPVKRRFKSYRQWYDFPLVVLEWLLQNPEPVPGVLQLAASFVEANVSAEALSLFSRKAIFTFVLAAGYGIP